MIWLKGCIDLYFGNAPSPIQIRLLINVEGVTYLFTLFQPDGMPDPVWGLGIVDLKKDFEILKNKFEL